MLICKSKTWKFPLRARWWLNVNCLTFMFILLKVPLYVQTKLSMWLEEHITKWMEKSNHQYKMQYTSCFHGTWESKRIFCWEKLFLCLQKCEENQTKINQNQITVCLCGKSLKPMPFSPKLEALDDSNPQVESHNVFALGRGAGVQRERAELQARVKRRGCNPSWARAGLFLRPLGSAKPIISSDAIQEVAQRRKEQVGACGGCHMRLCLCSKCVWYSGKWSAWLWVRWIFHRTLGARVPV